MFFVLMLCILNVGSLFCTSAKPPTYAMSDGDPATPKMADVDIEEVYKRLGEHPPEARADNEQHVVEPTEPALSVDGREPELSVDEGGPALSVDEGGAAFSVAEVESVVSVDEKDVGLEDHDVVPVFLPVAAPGEGAPATQPAEGVPPGVLATGPREAVPLDSPATEPAEGAPVTQTPEGAPVTQTPEGAPATEPAEAVPLEDALEAEMQEYGMEPVPPMQEPEISVTSGPTIDPLTLNNTSEPKKGSYVPDHPSRGQLILIKRLEYEKRKEEVEEAMRILTSPNKQDDPVDINHNMKFINHGRIINSSSKVYINLNIKQLTINSSKKNSSKKQRIALPKFSWGRMEDMENYEILNEEDIEKYKKRLLKHGLVMKELKKLKKALREAKGRESMNTRMVEALEKEVITVIQTKKSIAQERFIRFMSK